MPPKRSAQQVVNHVYVDAIQKIADQEFQRNPDSKLRYVYIKAAKVIKAHPLLLPSGSAAKKELKGVGDKIASILNELGVQGDGTPTGSIAQIPVQEPEVVENADKVVKKRKTAVKKPYQPAAKSGGYGILLALYLHSDLTDYMTKPDIIKHGEKYCHSSFTMPSTSQGSYAYTAWSSMTKLLKEDLVIESGNPKRYTLTEEGKQLAKKLSAVHDKGHVVHSSGSDSDLASLISSQSDMPPSSPISFPSGSNTQNSNQQLPNPNPNRLSLNLFKSRPWQPNLERTFNPTRTVPFQARTIPSNLPSKSVEPAPFYVNKFHQQRLQKEKDDTNKILETFSGKTRIMKSGTFEILLVLDNREVRSRKDRDYFQLQLEKRGVKVLTETLQLGDVCWVARDKQDHHQTIMLDYIIERKGKDDLISSIKDGRFKEQKTRLSQCGITNVIYLVEEFDPYAFVGDSLATALTETQIQHDFFVKCTANVEGSVEYLTRMTKLLQATIEPTDLEILYPTDINLDTHHLLRKHLAKSGKPCLIPLSTFSTLNSKSKNLGTKDFFQRQLMAIRGVSAEKAYILAKHFKSMGDLIQKLQICGGDDQKIKLIQGCSEANIPRRQFGKALAKSIITSLFG